LSKLVKPLQKYYYSGEINIEITGDRKSIIKELEGKYKDGDISVIDGLTVEYWDSHPKGKRWWFNVHPSNTEPLLRLTVEADTKELMDQKVEELGSEIKKAAL